MRVMIEDLSVPEALAYKEKIGAIDGVTDVLWLDDTVNITESLEIQDQETIESYYQESNALYTVTINEEQGIEAVNQLSELVGDAGSLEGTAVNTAVAGESTVDEISKIVLVTIPIVLVILLVTTNSWFEPVVLLLTIGVSILLSAGSNIIFGTVSFVTNGAGNILLLAVSLDYSVFLLHRFEDNRKLGLEPKESMVQALKQSTGSILASGLTTGISFAALILMRFKIGPDLGLALAKGIILSLLTVFILLPAIVLKTYKLLEKTRHEPILPDFQTFGKVVSKGMVPLAVIFSIVIVPSFLAQTKNSYYYGSEHIFGPETQLGQDSRTIEESFGQSNSMVLMVPTGDRPKELVLSEELQDIPEVTDVISYVDTVRAEIPTAYLDDSLLSRLESEDYSRMVLTVQAEYEGETAFEIIEEIRALGDVYYPDAAYLAGESASTYDLMDTINEEIRRNGKQVVIENPEDTLYYEGMLNSQELPWNISIQYFLDGVEYPAEELAGKSGALEIALKIEENTAADSFFFKNYGVQATLVLDTEKAKNIVAEEATIANVGKNKQLTYTILPGKGADISIQADVEDFEMDAIAINEIQLNLGLDFDLDDAALMAKVDELLSGVDRLDQGTHDLKSGAHQLKEGSTELDSGEKKLNDGTIDLNSGAHALQKGIQEINQALELLASQSDALVDGSAGFKTALSEVQSRLTEVSIDEEVQNEIDATLLEIMGDASETISFVSDKNTNVESAQFVLKTNAIEKNDETEELVEEETGEVSFWAKLKDLFRFNA